MDNINPFIKVNAGGIPRLEAINVTTTEGLVYTFKPHRFLNYPYAGLILFKLPAATSPLTDGSVYFTSDGGNKVQVFDSHGVAIPGNSATISLGGVFLGWYADGNLQLLTGLNFPI